VTHRRFYVDTNRPFQFHKRSQLFSRAVSERPLQDQTHRELVYRPFEFQKRCQLFIRTHNEPFSVIAVRISNPDRSPSGIN